MDYVAKLRELKSDGEKFFKSPIDIPSTDRKLDLESRRNDAKRQFKHIHQSCLLLSWDFNTVCKMRTLLLLDGYLALHDARAGLPIYSVTRSAIELHGLVLNVIDRLKSYSSGSPNDWKSRGEGFYSYLIRARHGTRDQQLIGTLTMHGVSKSSLEPVHSKDCETAIFCRKEYEKDRALYNKLCDYVHTNSQGYYVGSPGWYMSDAVSLGKSTLLLGKQPAPVNRYQYPVESKFQEAVAATAEAMYRHCDGIIVATNNLPESPYSEEEVLTHTGNRSGTVALSPTVIQTNPYAGQHIGRNDLCPCGSGKKYKHCHLN